jgi:hypothetical protein
MSTKSQVRRHHPGFAATHHIQRSQPRSVGVGPVLSFSSSLASLWHYGAARHSGGRA